MKQITKKIGGFLVGATLAFGTLNSHAQNDLIDPGFKPQTPAGQGGWTPFNGACFSTDYAGSGHWSIYALSATPSSLTPPDGRMVAIKVAVTTPSAQGQPVACKIGSVSCNESVLPGDMVVTGDLTLNLRAQCLGTGKGRIYTITVRCTDPAGSYVDTSVNVTVPHNQGAK
jgi:hypothetical protein